jgi:hypothetical protein
MNRAARSLPASVALVLAPSTIWAQGGIQYDRIEIRTDRIAPNLHAVRLGTRGPGPSGRRFVAMVYAELKAGR